MPKRYFVLFDQFLIGLKNSYRKAILTKKQPSPNSKKKFFHENRQCHAGVLLCLLQLWNYFLFVLRCFESKIKNKSYFKALYTQSKCVLETGLSDFHLMTVTVMRKIIMKMRPRVINYRSYKCFSNETFRVFLINNLSNEVFVNNDDGLQNDHRYFKLICSCKEEICSS